VERSTIMGRNGRTREVALASSPSLKSNAGQAGAQVRACPASLPLDARKSLQKLRETSQLAIASARAPLRLPADGMMRKTLWLMVALGLGLIAALAADAQQAGRVVRVGYLGGQPRPNLNLDALRHRLHDLGWIEGQNLVLEYRWGSGDRLPALMAELVDLKLDAIVVGAQSTAIAKDATKTMPIVFVTGDDPVATGLVASLARPGANMTGVTSLNVELDGKRFALLKQVNPRLARVAMLFNPDDPAAEAARAAVGRTARAAGVALQMVEARGLADFQGAIAAAARAGAEALAVYASPLFFFNQPRIAELSSRARLPAIAAWRQFPESGGLMSYGVSVPAMYRRAAAQVDRILRGARPADLPVEQATTIEFVINLKTARALGLTIPQSVLLQANHLVQ
jgi:putative tryptophan/tyrosine transport system substrate-binding protein